MPTVDHFLNLFEAISRKDWDEVKDIAESVAEDERKKRHYSAAARIRDAVSVAISVASKNDNFSPAGVYAAPIDLVAKGEELSSDPVLPHWLMTELGFLEKEWKERERLVEKSIFPRNTVLLHGAPGCGKTMLAHYIAKKLGREIYTVKFDSLVSSFLGETGSNIKKVFQFANANNCVLFVDEIDAIAKLRDDSAELGELKRVVITLLQNIDSLSKNSFLVAATNHAHMLDPAIWRRFDIVWELQVPNNEIRRQILEKQFIECAGNLALEDLIEMTKGMTGAALSRVINEARRKLVLIDNVGAVESFTLSLMEHSRRTSINSDGEQLEQLTKVILFLKKLDKKKYTFAKLEELTGIPHSTLHHRMRK